MSFPLSIRRILRIVPLTILLLPSSFATAASPGLEVTLHARSFQPGEVILVTAQAQQELSRLTVKLFDNLYPMFPAQSSGVWQGLVGIDLEVRPATYDMVLSATSRDGTSLEERRSLQVLTKEFPVRRLTVEGDYVSPPKSVQRRIEEESRLVSEILNRVSPEKLWDGPFIKPVPGEATSSFGKRSIYNGQPRSPHSGTDFRASAGTPILAPNAGKVVLVRDLYFAGKVVIVDHGLGTYSYFAHLSAFSTDEGAFVSRGDRIGNVGATGRVTGPHLHWTLRVVGSRVDPLSLIEVLRESSPAPLTAN